MNVICFNVYILAVPSRNQNIESTPLLLTVISSNNSKAELINLGTLNIRTGGKIASLWYTHLKHSNINKKFSISW